MEGLIHGGAYFRNFTVCGAVFYLPKVSRDFDVQIVISWSIWSDFLLATLFGNSEFFIFVLAFFLLIVSFYPYLL